MSYKETLAFYDELVSRTNKFERKGKTMPYTSANGYMFSLLNKDGQLGIRLPKASYTSFRETYNDVDFKSHGAVMREYVHIPEELLENEDLISGLLDEAFEYVMTLKPK